MLLISFLALARSSSALVAFPPVLELLTARKWKKTGMLFSLLKYERTSTLFMYVKSDVC